MALLQHSENNTEEDTIMTNTIHRAYTTAKAATLAAQAADLAIEMYEQTPDATWDYISLAYKFCRQAVQECAFALDSLEAEDAGASVLWEDARETLLGAMHSASTTASRLYEYAASMGQELLN